MNYISDTHSIIRHFADKLPPKAKTIFKQSESGNCIIYLPTIVLAECYYLMKKGKVALEWDTILARIESSDNYIPIPFDFAIMKLLPSIPLPELHDQIIVATAKRMNCMIITKDPEIKALAEIETVWA